MGEGMKNVGIMPHSGKGIALEVSLDLIDWLESRDRTARFLAEDAQVVGCTDKGMQREDFICDLDLVVSLGGDGAMLRAAALAYEADSPVVGINLGKKGFLTALQRENMYSGLEEIFSGNYLLQKRMMLECLVPQEYGAESHYALNEVVVGKRELQWMVRLEVDINGNYFHYYSGDGVIFATPTGSTAYSLSAGGPILDPLLDCIILTPICSHSLMDRSVIITSDSEVQVGVERGKALPSISLDGREEISLPDGGKITIRKAPRNLKMIKALNYSFFSLLREKFDFPEVGK
jgi:NAD+ kinase